jgi:hypothetical protein
MKYHKHIKKFVCWLLKNDIMTSGCLDRNGKPGEDLCVCPVPDLEWIAGTKADKSMKVCSPKSYLSYN